MSITVAFLARGVEAGLPAVQAFLQSYRAHPAGTPHRLVVLMKGWDGIPGQDEARAMAAEAGAEILDLPDDGFDWGAYFRLADVAETEFLFLLNSHSRILRDNWLAMLLAQAEKPGVGLVGCTGSWASLAPSLGLYWMPVLDRLRHDHRWLYWIAVGLRDGSSIVSMNLRNRWRFKPFPNPHIRSNAFVIRTSLLRDYAKGKGQPVEKGDAHALESGRESLTRYVSGLGLATLVCGADGTGFPPEDWAASGTFACPGQPNLIISDNQTRAYDERSPRLRRDFEPVVWGRFITPYEP